MEIEALPYRQKPAFDYGWCPATMEPGAASQEEKDFTNVATTRFTAPGHGGSATVARLGLRAGYATGPGKTLTVQRGDTVTVTAYAWLTGALAASAQAPPAQAARVAPYVGLDAPLHSPALVAPPGGPEHARTGGFNPFARLRLGGAFALGTGRTSQHAAAAVVQPDGLSQIHDGTAGNAQLHYIVRDASGATVLDDYQSANPGTAGTWQPLQVGLRLQQGGTVELRVETEGASGPDVYFDDVEVKHTASTIVQEQHQYAYGAPMLGLNYTVGPKSYRYGYQGQFAEKDEETGWDNFELRLYDSRIGRWMAPDPYGQFDSPYVGMGNNPVSGVDPDGGFVGPGDPKIIYTLGNITSKSWELAGVSVTAIRHTSTLLGTLGSLANAANASIRSIAKTPVSAPGTLESAIPVWGSGRQAVHDFQNGDYAWGAFNTAIAVSDVFLVKSIVTGVGRIAAKTAWKTAPNDWKATRAWIKEKNLAEAGQQVHHWLLHQNQGIGKLAPEWLKNQPWNLMNMPDNLFHQSLHNKAPKLFNSAQRLYYGTPQWTKAAAGSTGSRAWQGLFR